MGKAISAVGDVLSGLGVLGASLAFGLAGGIAAAFSPAPVTGDPTEWTANTDEPLSFPMGDRVPVAGTVNYRATYGPTNRYQSIVSTLAASGPIRSFIKTTIDDVETSFGLNDVATTGNHIGDLWCQTKLGTQPETAHTSPTGLDGGAAAPDWTIAHKMSGRASDMVTMKENSKGNGYQGGVVKRLHVVAGLKGWDPRQDSTWPGGSGSCRLDIPSTWVGISDGAIGALNWALGRWEGDSGGGLYGVPQACSLVGGIGATLESVDVAAFINAANVADANNWGLCACPDTKNDKFAVFTNLLQAAGALPSRIAGKLSCFTRVESQPSVMTVTAADLVAPPEVVPAKSRLERKNTGIGTYRSEAHRWEMTPIEEITNAAWLTEDRGRKRYKRPEFPYVPDADHAAVLTYYELVDDRESKSGVLHCKPHMRQIVPGDCLDLDLPDSLLDGVKVRVMRRRTNLMTGRVSLFFRQETDAKHADAYEQAGVTPPDTSPDTPPSDPGSPAEPPVTIDPPFPIMITAPDTITVSAVDMVLSDGTTPSFAGAAISGLDPEKTFGVFWREADGVEAVEYPAVSHMSEGGWTLLGWQTTPDSGGVFADPVAVPEGFGGSGPAPESAAEGLQKSLVAGAVVPATSAESMSLTAGATKTLSNDVSIEIGGQPFYIEGEDGDVLTFPEELPVPPRVVPLYDNLDGLASGEYYVTSPLGLTGAGMTARARRVDPGSSPVYTARVDDDGNGSETVNSGGDFAQRTKALSGVAYDGVYVATVDVMVANVSGVNSLTVGFYGRQLVSDPWTLLGTGSTSGGGIIGTPVARTIVINGNTAWSTWNVFTGEEYRVEVISNYLTAKRYITSFVSVAYQEQTGGGSASDVSALSDGRKIGYLVFPLAG